MNCYCCGAHLDSYDIGCHKKLINRGDTEYLCRNGLALRLGWERAEIDALIPRFQAQGCMLFPALRSSSEETDESC